ncbi:unnamed protein product [Cylindrotheca closterium]|uniref:Uncharacterized protein n=1 Tax=Cylindrotheca closterium TaxID=2856 RepID=A0AAD2G7J3_9STRA|nr:unnamed protein product [Cylindrotheca closterium]
MAMSTTKLVVSTGIVSTGALLGAASWYMKGVSSVGPSATLQSVTEKDAYVDTFYYKLPLAKSPKLSASILAKSLYCSPSFLPEKILLSLSGQSFPKESEYDSSLAIEPGTKIAQWTVDTARDEELLMTWPGGYTYLKANYLADSCELEFWFGSNLSAKLSASPMVRATMPFHAWYSRILCKNVAVTMTEYLKTK